MYTEEYITSDTTHLSYRYYKGTNQWLILFHGFGQSAAHFDALCQMLQPHYSILSIDLFFHGKSTYAASDNHAIDIDEWSSHLNFLLKTHNIERFSLLGFSIGGRFAVSSLYAFSKRIDQVILVAPDGIAIHFWYRLATSTWIARYIFRSIVLHPGFFLKICGLITSLKLMDDRIVKFAAHQMQSSIQREQVYRSWICFRKLKMSPSVLTKRLKHYSIPLKMIFGTKDRIVHQKTFDSLIQQNNAEIQLVQASHSMIHAALADKEVVEFIVRK